MTISNEQIFNMIAHWLACPENGYYGSSYGGKNITLSAPEGRLNAETSKEFMDKLQEDLPILVGRSLTKIVKQHQTITFSIDSKSNTYDRINLEGEEL